MRSSEQMRLECEIKFSHLCNDALDHPLSKPVRAALFLAATRKVEVLFDILRIDPQNDHNTRDTPQRVTKCPICRPVTCYS